MWRALLYLALLAIAAFAAVWLADRPGAVAITWQGYEVGLGLGTAIAILAAILMLLAFLWAIIRSVLHLPERMTFASRARRRARGYSAVSRGMVAVGAGDPAAARRHAGEAEKLLGKEPLALLLKAQAAQIAGDRAGAETAFKRMIEDPETRVLGLRGLFVEARRREDAASARAYAAEAARLAPSVGWANEAVLEAQCADGDWSGALATVERRSSLGLLDKAVARRHRAVLLTADALSREAGEPERATEAALEAVRLAPDLVPAAALAGRLLSRKNELRKASKVIEAAWKARPHPDLAKVYLDLRPGDAARDRLARAENLTRLSAWAPEARLALAQAAMEAREFARARDTLAPLLSDRPTARTCLLMAHIEAADHGRNSGPARDWIARAARAPRDPVWIADGVASDHWAPVSPVTGRLDAFVWQTPPDVLAAPDALLDDVVGDVDDRRDPRPMIEMMPPGKDADRPLEAAAAPSAAREPAASAPRPAPAPAATVPAPSEAKQASYVFPAGRAVPADEPAAAMAAPSVPKPSTIPQSSPILKPSPTETTAPLAANAPARTSLRRTESSPVIFPVDHAPDDPGPKAPAKDKARLFG